MNKIKIIIVAIVLALSFNVNYKVYADPNPSTQCTQTQNEPQYGVNASTDTSSSGAMGDIDDSAMATGSSFVTMKWTMDDGRTVEFDGYTNSRSKIWADSYGENGIPIDVSDIFGTNNPVVWYGNTASTEEIGSHFDAFMSDDNLFTPDKKTTTDAGLKLAQEIGSQMGIKIKNKEEAAAFLAEGQLDVSLNNVVTINGTHQIMNDDNWKDICSKQGGLGPLCRTLDGTVNQTDGCTTLGKRAALCAKPNSNNRNVTICEDCPDNPDFPTVPNLPQKPQNTCPQYTCQELYGKVCNGAVSRTCPDTKISGGGCGGFSYSQSSNAQYCSNRVGQEVPGTNGLSYYYCYEYGNVSAPSVPSPVFANRGFNLYGSFSANETRVCVKDNGANIYAEHAKRLTLYRNAIEQVKCKKEETRNLEKYINDLNATISSASKAWSEANNINCDLAKDKEKCENDKKDSKSHASSTQSQAEANKKTAQRDLEQASQVISGLEEIASKYLELTKETEEYINNYNATQDNLVTTSNSISVSNPIAKIGNYSISSGQVTSVNKNSASFDKIDNSQNAMPINYQFFAPNVANNTNGNISSLVSNIGININLSYDWSCPFNVLNYVYCTNDCGNKGKGEIKLIFRPISLTTPFPNNRKLGANWTEEMSEKLIANNRGVSDYEVYNLEPMYTIVLTPSDIKNIRNYNKTNSYNSFDEMECTNGIECRNTFLNDSTIFSTPISGCGMSSDWNACFSDSLAEYKESITTGINQKKDTVELFKERVNV